MYLFGFGSLINLNSAQKSFERTITQDDLIEVELKGYKKVWNSIESIKFSDDIEVNGVFLNLQKDENRSTLGVVIKITPKELEHLKLREKNYSCVTIDKSNILGQEIDDNVTFFMTTNEDKIAKNSCKNCFIGQKYIDIVENGLKNYSKEFQDRFRNEALNNFPFEIREGEYNFTDLVQNKFAKIGFKK